MHALSCPVCQSPLTRGDEGKRAVCPNGHSFDLAKQGYLNLLLSHKKKSKQPGDNTDMVAARTSFLDQGYYQEFADQISTLALECFQPLPDDEHSLTQQPGHHQGKPIQFLDIGCGEGYYTVTIAHKLNQLARSLNCTGLDISTPAIKACTRRTRTTGLDTTFQWLVASAYEVPMESSSIDLLTCLFCRFDLEEAYRLLKPGGSLMVASTGPNHLIEMRQALYDEVKDSAAFDASRFEKLSLAKHIQIQQTIEISSAQAIRDLLSMTPHVWRSSPDKQALLCQDLPRKFSLDFDIKILEK